MSLISFGTVALDNIKVPSGTKRNLLGGSAAHLSMSARLFTKVHLAGAIGRDFPLKHLNMLKRLKVNINSIYKADGKTFQWTGEYKKGDYNNAITLKTELGVIANPIVEVKKEQQYIPNVFLANIDPVSQDKFLSLMKNKKFIGLDSMNLWINIQKKNLLKLIKKVDLFVANDGEARMLTGYSNCIKAAKALRKLGPKLIVVKKVSME